MILAGFMISIGAIINLAVGGPIGAFMFSIGLLTILTFKFSLFTGKAGLLATKEIKPIELIKIWCGNCIGCFLGAKLAIAAGLGSKIVEPATAIINTRISNEWWENIFLGIFCGILMYIAVNKYVIAPYLTIMCVAGFILMGANHCIADMVYMFIAATKETFIPMITAIILTTIGNIVGCNIIGLA